MKIVFASYVYTPQFDNPEAWLKRINLYSGILQALAQNHTIISIEQINYEGQCEQDGVQYHFKKLNKIERRFPYRLHRFIKNLEPDVVFIHGLHFPLQVIQLWLHLGSKVRIIAQHHAELPFTGWKKWIQQRAYRYVDAYFFASRDMGLEWIKSGNLTDPDKIYGVMEVSSVFHQVNKVVAKNRTKVSGAPVFLWVGHLIQKKDPLNVVKAFLRFVKVNPLARLYMIYQTGELLPQMKYLLDKAPGERESIVLIGKVPHAELLYWFNSADFIISSSYYEGSGTAVCEAMSCGCIPVVTNILSFRMMTNNGNCGLLYQPGNEAALLECLTQTTQINMPQKREQVLTYYKAKLSFAAIAEGIERIATSLF